MCTKVTPHSPLGCLPVITTDLFTFIIRVLTISHAVRHKPTAVAITAVCACPYCACSALHRFLYQQGRGGMRRLAPLLATFSSDPRPLQVQLCRLKAFTPKIIQFAYQSTNRLYKVVLLHFNAFEDLQKGHLNMFSV